MKNFEPKAWLLPQPVLIIGTYDANGRPNAMNAAWGGQWDADEIMISMGSHATTANLELRGEFTVAFATVETLVGADYVGIVSAKNEPNKLDRTHWTALRAEHVDAPLFTNFPMTLECRIERKIDESPTGYYLIAKIVNITADERYLADDGKPDLLKMHLIVFDPIHHTYIRLGDQAGLAFSDGKQLKSK